MFSFSNIISLRGFVANKPERITLGNDNDCIGFDLVVPDQFSAAAYNDWEKSSGQIFRCTAYSSLEIIEAKKFKKGSSVVVTGRVELIKQQDKDGLEQTIVEVKVLWTAELLRR